jgi:hypothetical protein
MCQCLLPLNVLGVLTGGPWSSGTSGVPRWWFFLMVFLLSFFLWRIGFFTLQSGHQAWPNRAGWAKPNSTPNLADLGKQTPTAPRLGLGNRRRRSRVRAVEATTTRAPSDRTVGGDNNVEDLAAVAMLKTYRGRWRRRSNGGQQPSGDSRDDLATVAAVGASQVCL